MTSLFDIPAYRPGNETQRAAALAIRHKAISLREKVYQFIAIREQGATNEEIADSLGMKIQTVCGRVNELQKERRLIHDGEYRVTSSNCKAKVWKAVRG